MVAYVVVNDKRERTVLCYLFRFHNAADEKVIGHSVVTPVFDDEQLSVDEYRSKLHDVSVFLYLPFELSCIDDAENYA